jgi:hypothetical protein
MTDYQAIALGLSPSLAVIATCYWRVRLMRAQNGPLAQSAGDWELFRREMLTIIHGGNSCSGNEPRNPSATARHRLKIVR